MTTQEPLTDFIKKLTTEQLEDYKKKYQVLCSEKQKKDTYRQLRKVTSQQQRLMIVY